MPVAHFLEKELRVFTNKTHEVWTALQNVLFKFNSFMVPYYKEKYRSAKGDRIFNLFITSKSNDPNLGANDFTSISNLHCKIADQKREQGIFNKLLEFSPLRIESYREIFAASIIPIIFEEVVMGFKARLSPQKEAVDQESQKEWGRLMSMRHTVAVSKPGAKIVVFCHGFQGSHLDMMRMKHWIGAHRQDLILYSSQANNGQTNGDINKMGENLAAEVKQLISDCTSKELPLGSLSFIGHSMGNVRLIRRTNNKGRFASIADL